MGVRFIIGPAGSGKTQHIIDSVCDYILSRKKGANYPPLLVIVPDQTTFQIETSILADGRVKGFTDLQVLGFRRLALKVLEDTGGYNFPFITPVGRSMAVQAILWEFRNHLSIYKPMVDYPGFRDTLIRTFSEFRAYGVNPEELLVDTEESRDHAPFLSQKLADIHLIYSEYRNFISDRFLDPDDYLELAVPRICESDMVKDALVWIDGFSGFTPLEYQVIGEIIENALCVEICLCMDREELQHPVRETSLFHPVREIYEKITEICLDRNIPIEGTVFLGEDEVLPRFEHPSLLGVELEFRNKDRPRKTVKKQPPDQLSDESYDEGSLGFRSEQLGGIFLVEAVNPRAEVEFVAREITKLVRDQEIAFRDITLELRDLALYEDLIEMVFKDYDIPFFIDKKTSLSHHPAAELIRSAFDVVLTEFSFDSIFRYLKTDLVRVERDLVDELENYVLAKGIRGEVWIQPEPWRYKKGFFSDLEESEAEDLDEERIDMIRKQATVGLCDFYKRLKGIDDSYEDAEEDDSVSGGLTARDISLAVYDLLMELEVPKTLERWQEECENSGDLMSALEHGGAWDKIVEILEQSIEILGEHPCDVRTYASVIGAGLEDMSIGAIPPSLDQVLVGSLDRTRQPECHATFLLGAIEGEIPKKQGEDGIFTDKDREALLQAGIDLEPSSKIKQFHEQYLVYVSLTRPRKRLYVCYPLGDSEGKALFPSPIVRWLRDSVPVEEISVSIDPPGIYEEDIDYLVPATVWGLTARRLSLLRHGIEPGVVWREAYRWMLQSDETDMTRKILGSLGFTNRLPPLDQALSEKLYGSPLRTSVSRIERYQICPFQHFAQYGLGLKEREEFSLDPAKAGTFYHEAMREFVNIVISSDVHVLDLEPSDAVDIMDEIVKEMVPRIQNELFLSSFRYKHISNSLASTLKTSARLFMEHAKRGDFVPIAVEVPFGLSDEIPPLPLRLQGGQEALIRGLIDRVDAAAVGEDIYVRVVDYKSSQTRLDLTDVYYGLSLQLLVYLAVALIRWDEITNSSHFLNIPEIAGKVPSATILPAGAMYQPIQNIFIRTDGPLDKDSAWAEIRKKLRMTGIFMDDLEVARLMDKTSSAHSDLVQVQFTKSGLGAKSPVVSQEKIEALLNFAIAKVEDTCSKIISGRIDVLPFSKKQLKGCRYCPFGSFCTFDVLIEGNQYRVLKDIPKDVIWAEIKRYGEGEKK